MIFVLGFSLERIPMARKLILKLEQSCCTYLS